MSNTINYSDMKTSVIMLRDLNGFQIRQNHKTGFFNANDLVGIYNQQNDSDIIDIWDYLRLEKTKQYAEALIKDILQNTEKSGYLKGMAVSSDSLSVDSSIIVESKRGKYGGTWMHPYLFIDFAMWLSPEFKVQCIKWIHDRLISLRDEVGDTFKDVNKALCERNPATLHGEYINEARMINQLVFGNPDGGQRNEATEDQLDLLQRLQKSDVKLIEEGFSYYDRLNKLRTIKKILQFAS